MDWSARRQITNIGFPTGSGNWWAKTVEVTGLSWLDVDTPEALCEAERRLMRAAQ